MTSLFPLDPPVSVSARSRETDATIGTIFRRSLAYGTFAGCTLLAGTLMRASYPPLEIWYLVGAFALFTFFFALCHAVAHLTQGLSPASDRAHRHFIYAVVILTAACIASLTAVMLLLYERHTGSLPTAYAVITLGTHATLSLIYGFHLIRRQRLSQPRLIRHELIWPAVLTIAINFYVGLMLTQLQVSMIPSIPLWILGCYLFLSELFHLSTQRFWVSALLLVLAITATALTLSVRLSLLWTDVANAWLTLLFSLAIASYLAVFDGWRLTVHVLHRQQDLALDDTILDEHFPDPVPGTYYTATLVAHTASLLLIPWVFAFGKVRLLFLCAFILHGLISLRYWTTVNLTIGSLKQRNWTHIGNLFGVTGIAVLFADYSYKIDLVPGALPLNVVGILFAIATLFVWTYIRSHLVASDHWRRFRLSGAGIHALLRDPHNATRLLASLSHLSLAFTVVAQSIAVKVGGTAGSLAINGDGLIATYFIYIIVAALIEMWHSRGPGIVVIERIATIFIAGFALSRLWRYLSSARGWAAPH
jgi:hypothetical protein